MAHDEGAAAPLARMFAAIWPDPASAQLLEDCLDDGIRSSFPTIRWQPAERWHITLAFLGDVDESTTAESFSRVAMPSAEPIRLSAAGTFGSVLWVGIEHGPWLAELAGTLRAVLVGDSADQSRATAQPFRAHMTVGRSAGAAGGFRAGSDVRAAARAMSGILGPQWHPDEVRLVRSARDRQPVYTVAASSPLAR